MQMALAVNNSLMTLMKMQVFCTEPYRVPMAGKLDSCLFDKTGTLTTDELVAVGVLHAKTLRSGAAPAGYASRRRRLTPTSLARCAPTPLRRRGATGTGVDHAQRCAPSRCRERGRAEKISQ